VTPSLKVKCSKPAELRRHCVVTIGFEPMTASVSEKNSTAELRDNVRRERDSNPRTCYSLQFSRLTRLTALPSLRKNRPSSVNTSDFQFRYRRIHLSILQVLVAYLLKFIPLLRGLPTYFVAEREGFEPPDLLQSSVFKTDAINRSAISPYLGD
jgi:hypothetical protein